MIRFLAAVAANYDSIEIAARRIVLLVPSTRWALPAVSALVAFFVDKGHEVTTPVDIMRAAGSLDRGSIAYGRAATEAILGADAVLVGPNLGECPYTLAAVELADAIRVPVVRFDTPEIRHAIEDLIPYHAAAQSA